MGQEQTEIKAPTPGTESGKTAGTAFSRVKEGFKTISEATHKWLTKVAKILEEKRVKGGREALEVLAGTGKGKEEGIRQNDESRSQPQSQSQPQETSPSDDSSGEAGDNQQHKIENQNSSNNSQETKDNSNNKNNGNNEMPDNEKILITSRPKTSEEKDMIIGKFTEILKEKGIILTPGKAYPYSYDELKFFGRKIALGSHCEVYLDDQLGEITHLFRELHDERIIAQNRHQLELYKRYTGKHPFFNFIREVPGGWTERQIKHRGNLREYLERGGRLTREQVE